MVEEGFKQAEWNMALATLMRIDKLLRLSNEYQMQLDGENAYRTLRALYREVYPELTLEEKKEARLKLEKVISDYNDLNRGNRKEQISNEIIESLEDLDLYLREMLVKHDLYMNHKEDPSMAISRI